MQSSIFFILGPDWLWRT